MYLFALYNDTNIYKFEWNEIGTTLHKLVQHQISLIWHWTCLQMTIATKYYKPLYVIIYSKCSPFLNFWSFILHHVTFNQNIMVYT